jgi:hypothetical protein
LNVSELKINLSPGKPGRNKSLPFFLEVVGGGRPGVWNNEIRVYKSQKVPVTRADFLATLPITCDVSNGFTKYRKMKDDFEIAQYKGVAEENQLAEPTEFDDPALKAKVVAKLKTVGITPVKFYFTNEDWETYGNDRTGERYSKM